MMSKIKLTEAKTTYVVTGVIITGITGPSHTVALFQTDDKDLADKCCSELNAWAKSFRNRVEGGIEHYKALCPLDVSEISDDAEPYLEIYDAYEVDPVVGVA